jgi:hypothetical protein
VSPTPRTLTMRARNRALLARQHLLERAAQPLPRVLEQMGGLQAQYAPSMYIGLWSRVAGFEREQLTQALHARRVIQGTLMRVTIHLVSAADYWPFAVGVREARRRSWLRLNRQWSAAEMDEAADRVRQRLADGPMRRTELDALVAKDLVGGVGLWVDLVRVPPAGTWERRRADLYGLASEWVGPADVSVGEGVDRLVRRYLGAFGPATPGDLAGWAGLGIEEVTPALARLEVRRFRDEDARELVDLRSAPLPDPDTPAPVRFLPTWDATLLGHARRCGVLPEEHRTRIFHMKYPQSFPTFLVDGAVAGTWTYVGGRVELAPFGRLSKSVRAELEAEAEGLARLHA